MKRIFTRLQSVLIIVALTLIIVNTVFEIKLTLQEFEFAKGELAVVNRRLCILDKQIKEME